MRVLGRRVVALVAVPLLCAACGASEPSERPLVVGSADDVRGEVLAHIYAGALASTGADVRTSPRIGDRDAYLAALDAAEVDVVPDLTGELLGTFDSADESVDADDVFVALNKSLPAGLSVTDYATAEDRPAVAVTPNGVLSEASTIDDIAAQCSTATVVVADADRAAVDTLAERYGCTFASVTAADNDAVVPTLLDGSADVALIRTASAGPGAKDLLVLEDDAEA
ncbi:MAG: glycine betaine ABC transporter substrate-binding protein, partial [Rhodococcus sp. (in: high G+C Gram-positive bacteria)]